MDQSKARTPPLRRWINQRDLARRWNLTTGALKRRRARGLPPHQWWPFSGTCVLYDLTEIEALETEGLTLRRRQRATTKTTSDESLETTLELPDGLSEVRTREAG